jgi:hypothetical protein
MAFLRSSVKEIFTSAQSFIFLPTRVFVTIPNSKIENRITDFALLVGAKAVHHHRTKLSTSRQNSTPKQTPCHQWTL